MSNLIFTDASTQAKHTPKPMSEMDKKILHREIREKSKVLFDEFSSLHLDTCTYLEEIHCNVHKLLTCVMDIENETLASNMPTYAELKRLHMSMRYLGN